MNVTMATVFGSGASDYLAIQPGMAGDGLSDGARVASDKQQLLDLCFPLVTNCMARLLGIEIRTAGGAGCAADSRSESF